MAIITLRLATVNSHPTDRPSQSRFCGHTIVQKRGTVSKAVRDSQMRTMLVHRYHCPACQRTFRHYPTGIERADQSLRYQLFTIGTFHRPQSMTLCARSWQIFLMNRPKRKPKRGGISCGVSIA